jgi:hypothetical protein
MDRYLEGACDADQHVETRVRFFAGLETHDRVPGNA